MLARKALATRAIRDLNGTLSQMHQADWQGLPPAVPRLLALLGMGCALLGLGSAPAAAQRIENSVAIFAALDKVTAKISKLEVPLNQTAKFGALKITPRACYTRAPTEPPKTTTFVEVDEVMLDDREKRIFAGWMFADSPGLNAVEHPVFDVWLTDCTAPVRTAAPTRPGLPSASGQQGGGVEPPLPSEVEPRRRRPPR
jgi:hypothetical protein